MEVISISEYTMTTEYIERKHGFCGHIIGIAVRCNKNGEKEIVFTTDEDINKRKR